MLSLSSNVWSPLRANPNVDRGSSGRHIERPVAETLHSFRIAILRNLQMLDRQKATIEYSEHDPMLVKVIEHGWQN